jgi:hypothetical protein
MDEKTKGGARVARLSANIKGYVADGVVAVPYVSAIGYT